jgi:SAM-dependent methyltransferase
MSPAHSPDEYAPIADLYNYVPLYSNRTDVEFFIEAAKAAGSPVLEIGCGTGRVLIPIARAGVTIVGLDASASMLSVCRRLLDQEPAEVRARVELVQGDMRSFALKERFTLATIPFRPFQHLLTITDQLACLENIRRHLVPGGRLILDLFNPSLDYLANRTMGEEVPDGDPFSTPDGRQVRRTSRTVKHDRFAQVNTVELIYYVTHPDGREERLVHAFGMRYLWPYEAAHLLVRAGFSVEHLYADYEKHPFGSTYPGDLIFVAKT